MKALIMTEHIDSWKVKMGRMPTWGMDVILQGNGVGIRNGLRKRSCHIVKQNIALSKRNHDGFSLSVHWCDYGSRLRSCLEKNKKDNS